MLVAPRRHHRRDAGGEQRRGPERAERRREAEAVGDDETGERRRPDRVRVEGEAAEHDPRPQQAAGQREQEDLHQPALHEGERERLQHETESTSYLRSKPGRAGGAPFSGAPPHALLAAGQRQVQRLPAPDDEAAPFPDAPGRALALSVYASVWPSDTSRVVRKWSTVIVHWCETAAKSTTFAT